jgi:ABC-type antimicrobial peptide transport system permease subunit
VYRKKTGAERGNILNMDLWEKVIVWVLALIIVFVVGFFLSQQLGTGNEAGAVGVLFKGIGDAQGAVPTQR